MKNRGGYTLIEILIAIAILVMMTTIITISLSKLNSSQAVNDSATLVVSILNEARSLTLSSVEASQYGVHLEDSQVVLFKGGSYSSLDSSNIVTELNTLVGLRNIALSGGGTSVVFERLTGNTDEAGMVELFLRASPTTFRTITINATGVVQLD